MLDENGESREVPVRAVVAGDRLLIRPGSRIPVDGIVAEGSSAIDMSSLTGEPVPVEVKAGDEVAAGTMNVTEPSSWRPGMWERIPFWRALSVWCGTRRVRVRPLPDWRIGSVCISSLQSLPLHAGRSCLVFPRASALRRSSAHFCGGSSCCLPLRARSGYAPCRSWWLRGRGAQLGVLIKAGLHWRMPGISIQWFLTRQVR